MSDYFFNSMPNMKFNRSKSQSDILDSNRYSSFNLSGSEIVYNNNNFMNNKKKSITSQLKNNNLLAHKQLDEINNEYNNMKNFLNDKVSRLEQQQQMQFDALRNYLEENKLLEEMKLQEKYRNRMNKEIQEQVDYEYNKKKDMEKIRNLGFREKIGKKRAMEKEERKKFLKEMDYFEKIQRLDQMEKVLLRNNIMRQRYEQIYKNSFFPPPFPGANSPFISPFLANLINANNYNHKQEELLKLFLLKNLMEDDKPKKERPLFVRPPKYIIQKYYPPAPSTHFVPVPQPILFQSSSSPSPPSPKVIIQREPSQLISPRVNIVTREAKKRKKTDYESSSSTYPRPKHRTKHIHNHRHSPRHDTYSNNDDNNDNESEPKEKSESEDKPEEEEENPEEKDEEEEKPEEEEDDKKEDKAEEEESTDPEVRLKLYDPDNPESNRIVYPVRNQS